jgi:HPt (histidine-containing phosphotransfer) domain-containing protein
VPISNDVKNPDSVLNLARLQEAYDDDKPAIANLLGLARDTELRYINALRAGMAGDDIAAVARAAHSIKGSASNIGAGRVSGIAANIEDQARRGLWEGIAAFADELDRGYAELSTRITEYAAAAV